MQEKMEYQLEERTRDMQELLESCQTKVCCILTQLNSSSAGYIALLLNKTSSIEEVIIVSHC